MRRNLLALAIAAAMHIGVQTIYNVPEDVYNTLFIHEEY